MTSMINVTGLYSYKVEFTPSLILVTITSGWWLPAAPSVYIPRLTAEDFLFECLRNMMRCCEQCQVEKLHSNLAE